MCGIGCPSFASKYYAITCSYMWLAQRFWTRVKNASKWRICALLIYIKNVIINIILFKFDYIVLTHSEMFSLSTHWQKFNLKKYNISSLHQTPVETHLLTNKECPITIDYPATPYKNTKSARSFPYKEMMECAHPPHKPPTVNPSRTTNAQRHMLWNKYIFDSNALSISFVRSFHIDCIAVCQVRVFSRIFSVRRWRVWHISYISTAI